MLSKLGLNPQKIAECRSYAARIASEVQNFVDEHSSISVERSIARLMGVDGVNQDGHPYPNLLTDFLKRKGLLSYGFVTAYGNILLNQKINLDQVISVIDSNPENLDLSMKHSPQAIDQVWRPLIDLNIQRIQKNKRSRERSINELGEGAQPYLYVIVATGNIFEDLQQAKAAARQGADVIAVIRSTGQSLLDYVPFGATTEGFGGTFATQENFRIMRQGLDEVGAEQKRYIRLCNYCSGLCMSEIAAMGALERLDMMLNDALYGILFRDINMQRTLIDQYFSRVINGYSGIIINTGEDNYLTTADAVEEAHTVLASNFINEQLALIAKIPKKQMGLGHAFEIDPELENGFLLELAQAQMIREIFPEATPKYMPPTKFMTGNIFKGVIQNTLFNIASIWTHQGIQLLGMMTEAIHTPFMADRYLSIENARYVFNNLKNIGDEINFKENGLIQQRSQEVLNKTHHLLAELEKDGLFQALSKGVFAGIKRSMDRGKGLDGVFRKNELYRNPFLEEMLKNRVD